MRQVLVILLLAPIPWLTGCTTTPTLDRSRVESEITPAAAVDDDGATGRIVNWGGEIIRIHNFESETEIEILSYPLSKSGYPQTSKPSTGRALVIHRGFLEPTDYRQGRLLTVVGRIDETRDLRIGEAGLRVPVLRSEQLQLLPIRREPDWEPFFSIGVGIDL